MRIKGVLSSSFPRERFRVHIDIRSVTTTTTTTYYTIYTRPDPTSSFPVPENDNGPSVLRAHTHTHTYYTRATTETRLIAVRKTLPPYTILSRPIRTQHHIYLYLCVCVRLEHVQYNTNPLLTRPPTEVKPLRLWRPDRVRVRAAYVYIYMYIYIFSIILCIYIYIYVGICGA